MNHFWKGRKVLVTGAGGFIGSHLVEALLNRGAQVTALLHYDSCPKKTNLEYLPQALLEQLQMISGDICDPFFVRKAVASKDTVFHLAALIAIPYSFIAPHSYVKVNIEGTLNIAEACHSEGVRRLVHTSTSEVYGSAIYSPINETHPLRGQSPYSATKIGADKMIESYFLSFDLPVATLRPFNTYGPRQSARAIIPTILTQLLSNVPELKLGDLNPIRDFSFVKDTVSAFLAVAENDACLGKTLNSGSGNGVSMGELVAILQRLTQKDVPILEDQERFRPRKSEVQQLIACTNELRSLTGWTPQFNLEAGLMETLRFVETHIHSYKKGEYTL